ncbi:hypothetical protein Cni_G28922 [Canna indica]|uniref:PGG domain-containing protein n=1 Tax=Canna indica TaxID=4628 RepID=A0AAQ3L4V8_9LILI|nr:hypothetical protein Cni_G28922 [Canna indica]
MMTIPDLFRSQSVLGPLYTFLYKFHIDGELTDHHRYDQIYTTEQTYKTENTKMKVIRPKFKKLKIYKIKFVLLPIYIYIARHVYTLFRLLFPFQSVFQCTHSGFLPIQRLESNKKKYKVVMDLVGHLANKKEYFDFYYKGYSGEANRSTSFPSAPDFVGNDDSCQHDSKSQLLHQFADKLLKYLSFNNDELESSTKDLINNMQKVLEEMSGNSDIRWHESPLITSAKLGLDDFVCKVLQVCPQLATYLDLDGRNVLQAAIKYGRKEIVKTIGKMTQGNNPRLPSWLYSYVDVKTGNTILHFASEKAETTEDALQLHDELKWFEIVRKILPKELWNIRNLRDKTAQVLFTEKHEKTLNTCKTQLIEMGKTCSALVAAVVFASSFSIPGEKDPSTGNPLYFNRMPFKIFSHAYVIGFACAATSLVLFLSLVITPYKEHDFRWAIPLKYFFACLSFAMALLAFLISSTCNIFLQIYGGQRTETKDLIPLLVELTVFPAMCFLLLLYSGASFGPSFSRMLT